MWEVLGRIFVVGFSLLMSIITALAMLVMLGGRELGSVYKGQLTEDNIEIDPLFNFLFDISGMFFFFVALGPALTILPALLVVIVGEVARIRTLYYYVLAAGLVVLAIPFMYTTGDGIQYVVPNARYMTIFAASGFVAGFIYWALAGRKA